MASTTILSDNGVSSGSAGIKTTGGNDGTLQLQTTTAGGAATTAVTIDTSQNVGIGTNSPSGAKVQIVGDNSALRVGDGTRDMYVDPDSGGIFLSNGAGQSGEGFYLSATGNSLRMFTASAERARIDSSGNLLVGTTSSGNSNTKSFVANIANGYIVVNHLNGQGTGSGYASFGYNGSEIGYISQNGTTAVAYNTTSDYRLKENVQPMTGALSVVQALKPCTYTWKTDGSDGQGFIAHELQAVVPDCVTGEKDAVEVYTDENGVEQTRPKYQGIDTSFLVATLTAAIQEQQALITQLTERIAALEAK